MLTADISNKTTANTQSLLVRPPGGAGLVRVAPGRADLARLIRSGALAVTAEKGADNAQTREGQAKAPSGPAKARTTKGQVLTRAEALQARVAVLVARATAAERMSAS